jgi:hypothetical protein
LGSQGKILSGEPANFTLQEAAQYRTQRLHKSPIGPVPTLADLQQSMCWCWIWCQRCEHHAPMAFAPLVIRWGPTTSSDKLRECARCTACGWKGASLQHPSWIDRGVSFQPFPVPAN